MTVVDWVIVALTAMLALHGYARGFIVGALSLVGFAVGALIGTRLAPLILPSGARSPYAPLFGLVGALLVGGVFASGFQGVGRAARRVLRIPGLRVVDGFAGAVLTGCVGLGIAWMAGALLLLSSGSPTLRHDLRASVILRELDRLLPPSGPILNALARFDPLPSLSGPSADVPAPARGILAAAGVRDAAPSVVRVLGSACGLGIEGSGWVAGPGLVAPGSSRSVGSLKEIFSCHSPATCGRGVDEGRLFDPPDALPFCTADSGRAMSSSDCCSAAIPSPISTRPPMIMTAAPMR